MRKHTLMLLGTLMLLSAQPAHAQQEPMDARSLSGRAVKGDAFSAYYLGYMYQTGTNGVRQNYQQAITYYTMAGKLDYVDAEVNLGTMYLQGMGIEPSPTIAAQWYYSAALHGNNIAENALANLYYAGNGVPKDFKKAFDFYTRAQKHGNVEAGKHLGDMYLNGEGVTADKQEAIKWYTTAAKKGSAGAQRQLAALAKSGEAQGLLDEQGVVNMYKSAAMKGDANAEYNLGRLYETGENNVKVDVGTSIKWYRKAANQGQPDAQHALGKAYLDGKGVAQDYQQAWFWFSLAAAASTKQEYSNDRDVAALKLTPEQIAQGQSDVQNFKPKQDSGGVP